MKELAKIQEVFRSNKPTLFVDPNHCSECEEHNQVLLDHTIDTISLSELGNPGWDPICFVDRQGFKYYLPALARLSLGTGDQYYLGQFLFHLNPDRIREFTRPEASAVADFLEALVESIPEEIDCNLDSDGVLACIENLRANA